MNNKVLSKEQKVVGEKLIITTTTKEELTVEDVERKKEHLIQCKRNLINQSKTVKSQYEDICKEIEETEQFLLKLQDKAIVSELEE